MIANAQPPKRRLVIGITGATGSIYALRLLQILRNLRDSAAFADIETHLVISPSGVLNVKYELGITRQHLYALADVVYGWRDIGSALRVPCARWRRWQTVCRTT